jgi:hypothetical protein
MKGEYETDSHEKLSIFRRKVRIDHIVSEFFVQEPSFNRAIRIVSEINVAASRSDNFTF